MTKPGNPQIPVTPRNFPDSGETKIPRKTLSIISYDFSAKNFIFSQTNLLIKIIFSVRTLLMYLFLRFVGKRKGNGWNIVTFRLLMLLLLFYSPISAISEHYRQTRKGISFGINSCSNKYTRGFWHLKIPTVTRVTKLGCRSKTSQTKPKA